MKGFATKGRIIEKYILSFFWSNPSDYEWGTGRGAKLGCSLSIARAVRWDEEEVVLKPTRDTLKKQCF